MSLGFKSCEQNELRDAVALDEGPVIMKLDETNDRNLSLCQEYYFSCVFRNSSENLESTLEKISVKGIRQFGDLRGKSLVDVFKDVDVGEDSVAEFASALREFGIELR